MSQIRLLVTGTEAEAALLLDLMSAAFEEEGYPVATMEIDEAGDVWEACVYVDAAAEPAVHARMAELLGGALAGRTIAREVLPDIDWVAKSLEGLKPVRAGRFVVHGSHDRPAVRPGETAIEIDAGQAFGTGHHGTTFGCLEMIESVLRRRRARRALDLGTGSGALAIAMAKLQPLHVLATDIDPIAIRVARQNMAKNGIRHVRLETAAGFHAPAFLECGPFDLIAANILARPLMKMAPDIARHVAPGGSVILSGILAGQRWKVLSAFNGQRFAHRRTLRHGDWTTLLLER